MEQTKWCSKCLEVKLVSEFYKYSRSKDGCQSLCKICCKQYHENNRDKTAEYNKQYYEDNKDEIKQHRKDKKDKNSRVSIQPL